MSELFFNNNLILDGCILFQVMSKARQKGEQELIAKIEKLMIQLEKLGRRIEELPHYSELDMMQQVKGL